MKYLILAIALLYGCATAPEPPLGGQSRHPPMGLVNWCKELPERALRAECKALELR